MLCIADLEVLATWRFWSAAGKLRDELPPAAEAPRSVEQQAPGMARESPQDQE